MKTLRNIGILLILFVFSASAGYLAFGIYHQANLRLIFPVSPGDEVSFTASAPRGSYAIQAIKSSGQQIRNFHGSPLEIQGLKILVTEGGNVLLDGPFSGKERVTMGGYGRDRIGVTVTYEGDEGDDLLIILGMPL